MTWKKIPGYGDKYEINELGQVRSIQTDRRRSDGRLFNYNPRILPVTRKNDYPAVKFSWDRKTRTFYVHRLLAQAFIPNPEGHPIVRHLNDNRDDLRLENLAWGTQAENMRDVVRNGNHKKANQTNCKRGHELVRIGDRRICRICSNASSRRSKARARLSHG